MIQIGSIRILSNREFSKYEKLHKIFRVYSTQELDDILAGKIHLRRNPARKSTAPAYPYRPPSANDGTL
jgi:hypothetical protein